MKKTIVISAVNLTSGGTLTVLRNCLKTFSESSLSGEYRVIALVHDKGLADYPNIEYIKYPKSKKSWINRVYYEYFGFKKLSKRLRPHLWLSLHDMTPNVRADIRAVYCHNPTPFYKAGFFQLRQDYKVVLFSFFYKYLYRINIRKNDYVIVQQSWMRDAFAGMYGLPKEKIVVAYANPSPKEKPAFPDSETEKKEGLKFFYPALPRIFKNFEVICRAVRLLNERGASGFAVKLTIDGKENPYAAQVWEKYKGTPNLEFAGLIESSRMEKEYQETDCLIFPSKLETWGLPLSEYGIYDRPILAADLPYAYEASNGAKYVEFFDPDSAEQLADAMQRLIKGDWSRLKENKQKSVEKPFTKDWESLINLLITGVGE